MTIFFTVATLNYLPQAVTLLDSVKQHHPEFKLFIALADYLPEDQITKYTLATKYPLVQLHQLKVEELDFITSNYSPAQLSNGVKVLFAEYFFKSFPVDRVIFCDSDIVFFNRFPNLESYDYNIIVTPHFTNPPPLQYKIQELEVLKAGLYNGGCVILNRSEETFRYINWLRERSVLDCVFDQARGIYVEQLWLNFLPLYFKGVFIERNVGCNVAYWNLHEREISGHQEYTINGTQPLVFFHYSGWDFSNPLVISKWGRYTIDVRPDIEPLLKKYRDLLEENQFLEYKDIPNYYVQKQQLKIRKQRSVRNRIIRFLKKLTKH